MLASICSEPKVLEVMRIVNTVISIIRIVVPILLIFVLAFKLISAITNNDKDSLAKVKKTAIPNIVAAVIIFLIPTLINIVIEITIKDNEYKQCLQVKSIDDIQNIYLNKMEELVSKAEETLDINDYNNAMLYLSNIKDEEKKKELEERLKLVKEQIDEMNKEKEVVSTGLGSDLPLTKEITTACNYIFNEETAMILLHTCDGQHMYKYPGQELPGGAVFNGIIWYAKKSIPLSKYRMGLFFGEIPPDYSTDNFLDTFAIMYTTVLFTNTIPRQIRRGEADQISNPMHYTAGSCAQNYRESLYRSRYESGKYREKINQIMEETRYFIMVNDDGTLTDVRYNTSSGILDVMKKSAKAGKDIVGMLEDMKSGHNLAGFYKKAHIYDCRNLIDAGIIDSPF